MATTQDRIQGLLGDLGVKPPVRVATTAAITLSGEQTIDGVAVVAEDRVLVKDQADTTTNGIYYCQASTWVRAPDFDGTRDAVQGTLVVVATGTANAGTFWRLMTADPVIGTSNLTFSLFPISATAFVQTLLDDASASAFLTTLGFSAFSKTLIDDADAATARATLGAVGLTGNETVAGDKTFSGTVTPMGGIVGTATNDNAAAGSVGEEKKSTVLIGSAVPLTAAATANVTSISLTAGDWEISGYVKFSPAATTSITSLFGGSSTTSATAELHYAFRCAAFVPAGEIGFDIPPRRLSLASTTTVYLYALANFTVSTNSAFGEIRARRVR